MACIRQQIWEKVRIEAEQMVAEEPMLASFFHSTILKHQNLGSALSYLLANKLANPIMPAISLREIIEEAYAGDIIGLHNHGTIQIGDTFTQGENLKFTGIPNFAPELFRRIRLKDPLKQKQLLKGLVQLSEEGAVQVFRPLMNNDLIVGAVGVLQFDVVVSRLKTEYNVEAIYETVNVATARWVECKDAKKFEEFKRKNEQNLALDGGDNLTYIAPTMVNLNLAQERYPEVEFFKTREH